MSYKGDEGKYSTNNIGSSGYGSSAYNNQTITMSSSSQHGSEASGHSSSHLSNSNSNRKLSTNDINIQINTDSSPLVQNDSVVYEVLSKAGPEYTYMRRDYVNDIGALAKNSNSNTYGEYCDSDEYHLPDSLSDNNSNVIKLDSPDAQFNSDSIINQDPDPVRIVKANNQNLVYKQQVNVRYLQPPTPPPPAPIIIREKQCPQEPCKPPIIIR
jgi:hypothetical protein